MKRPIRFDPIRHVDVANCCPVKHVESGIIFRSAASAGRAFGLSSYQIRYQCESRAGQFRSVSNINKTQAARTGNVQGGLKTTRISMKNKTLVTSWHFEDSQIFVVPGDKKNTRQFAAQIIGQSPRKIKGVESWMTDSELKKLPEYEG